MEPDTVALSTMRTGQHGIVVRIDSGIGLLGRMIALGVTPGAGVTILQNVGRGPLIARVREARIALGRGEAERIYVHPELE